MIFVEKLRIDAVQLAHTQGKVALRGFDKKVVMVCHKAIGMTNPIISGINRDAHLYSHEREQPREAQILSGSSPS